MGDEQSFLNIRNWMRNIEQHASTNAIVGMNASFPLKEHRIWPMNMASNSLKHRPKQILMSTNHLSHWPKTLSLQTQMPHRKMVAAEYHFLPQQAVARQVDVRVNYCNQGPCVKHCLLLLFFCVAVSF